MAYISTYKRAVATFSALLMLSIVNLPVHSAEIYGKADIIDGDTVKIWQQSIRLIGIDAPETGQTCQDAKGNVWRCGIEATKQLQKLTANKEMRCAGTKTDRYKRLLAICFVGSVNVNAWMVKNGFAVAYTRYSDNYIAEQLAAKQQRLGLWQGTFISPEKFRANKWLAASKQDPNNANSANNESNNNCVIKGNISRNGNKIYHMPWSKHYKRTQINVAKGERWFCDENQALDAGWRAPK